MRRNVRRWSDGAAYVMTSAPRPLPTTWRASPACRCATFATSSARQSFLGEQRLRRLIGTSLDSQIQLLSLCRLPAKDRDSLIERAASGEPVSARAIWRGMKKRRGKTPLRARPSPPLDEPTPAPPDHPNPITLAWRAATSRERREFVRAARDVTGGVNPRIDGGGSSVAGVSRRPRWSSMAGWQAL